MIEVYWVDMRVDGLVQETGTGRGLAPCYDEGLAEEAPNTLYR